ncbi:hypothetical protein Tco_0325003 [Tanacetum coccineum]
MDEEVARNLEAQLQAKLEEQERISRLKEEKSNIALLESWDNTQAMMDADFQLAQQMQTEEQEQLTQEKRSKPPTKAQKRNKMSTYLKNMAGYKHNQLKSKMVEPEKSLKKKDQIAMDEEVARNLEAQLQAELEEEENISRLKEEKANIALLESWDNTQAMMDADF